MLATTYGQRFHAKADQESYDFLKTDLTTDYQYHDLDLSSIIPAGTVAVLLWGAFKGDVAHAEVCLAKAGYSGNYLKALFFQPIVNEGFGFSTIIPVSSDRKIKYRISNVNWIYINLQVVGWFV